MLFSISPVVAAEEKKEIVSLDEAKTVAEIRDYISQVSAQASQTAQSRNEKTQSTGTRDQTDFFRTQSKLFRTIGEVSVAGGEKILKITEDQSELAKGVQIKISGLKYLIAADNLDTREQKEPPVSQHQVLLDNFINELEKDGRFPFIVNNERLAQLTDEANKLRRNFNAEDFEKFIKRAKKLSHAQPARFKPIDPLFNVLEVVVSVSGTGNKPQLVDDTIKDFTNFVNSEEFDLSAEEKKSTLEQLGNSVQIIINNEHLKNLSTESNELHKNFTAEKFETFVDQAKKLSVTKPAKFKPIDPFRNVIDILSSDKVIKNNPQLADKTFKDLIAFVNSEEFNLSEQEKTETLEQLEGYSLRVIGANPEIYGKTVDDKDFDWNALRGKYVLVKFTASWCGPCKAEIPGLLSAYEKYHGKGFEIVSIYVWDKLPATKKIIEEEKIPWICLSEELTEKAGLPLQGKKYA
ncbi:MAG: TlpA family protein disulfide reductase, partial [Planctomycetaceae bacterium]|nr:TlpA family protein disulfide reductase [Planctomycetaceae bacterium]